MVDPRGLFRSYGCAPRRRRRPSCDPISSGALEPGSPTRDFSRADAVDASGRGSGVSSAICTTRLRRPAPRRAGHEPQDGRVDMVPIDPQHCPPTTQEARQSTGTGPLASCGRSCAASIRPCSRDRGSSGPSRRARPDPAAPVTVDRGLQPGACRLRWWSRQPILRRQQFLANVVKHSRGRNAWVVIAAPEDGCGCLSVTTGTVVPIWAGEWPGRNRLGGWRRVDGFDGDVEPGGGPTGDHRGDPMQWLSPRTTSSSGTG